MRVRPTAGAGAALAAATLLLGVGVASPADAAPGDTTTTFVVSGGALTISVPASAALGSGAPGGTISAQLGSVAVSDLRALLTAAWTASVVSTTFTTGGGTAAETVPLADISYWSGAATATSGSGTFTPGQLTAVNAQVLTSSRTSFALTLGVGNNSASWNPTIVVAVPAAAVGGTYTGTVTHSVA
jgi:hypothetical protein